MGHLKIILGLVCFVAAVTPNHGIARLPSDLQGDPKMMEKMMGKEGMVNKPMIMKTRMMRPTRVMRPSIMMRRNSVMRPEIQSGANMMNKKTKKIKQPMMVKTKKMAPPPGSLEKDPKTMNQEDGMDNKPMVETTMVKTTTMVKSTSKTGGPFVLPRPIEEELEPTPVPENGSKCDRIKRKPVRTVWGRKKFGPYGGNKQYVDCITLKKGNRMCKRGYNWYQDGNALIVKKGCGGVFEICLKNKKGEDESPEDPEDEGKEEDPKDEDKEDRCMTKADGNYAEDGCESYYICVDEVEQGTQQCPEGLLFNDEDKVCDFPINVNKNTCDSKKVKEDGSDSDNGDSGQSGDTEEPEQGPKCDKNQPDGYYTYDNCKKFYRCVNNMKLIPEENECGDDKLFNLKLNVCDWKDNVDIDSCSEQGTGTDDEDLCTGKEDGTYGTNGCKSYYTCEDGEISATQACQDGLFFNKNTGGCDWSYNVNANTCEGNNNNEDSEDKNGDGNSNSGDSNGNDNQSGDSGPKCKKGQPDGYYTYDNCKKFYRCVNNMKLIPEENECWDDKLFNLKLNVCDWKDNVDSDSCSEQGTGTDNEDRCAEREDGVYGTNGCKSYYTCKDGKVSATQACQDGLLFNKKIRGCDWSYNVNANTCEGNDSGGDSGDNNGDGNGDDSGDNNGSDNQPGDSERCKEGEDEGVQIKLEDCSGFYTCLEGYKYTRNCPDGTKFNADKGICDFPYNVDNDCGTATEDKNEEENPNNLKKCTDEEKRNRNGTLEGCIGFYTCVGDFKFETPCQPNLLYDKIAKRCEPAFKVNPNNCMPTKTDDQGTDGQGTDGQETNGQGTDGQGTDGQGTSPKPRVRCGPSQVNGGYYTLGQGCKRFYRCDRGFGTIQKCPKDQLFNTDINTCDWESNVNIETCGTGVVVTTDPPKNNGGETTTTKPDKNSFCDYKITKVCRSTRRRKVRTCRINVNPEKGASVCLSLKQRLSRPLQNGYGVCKQARDWHYDQKSVTVKKGCKASFVFCIKKCQIKKTITCKKNICRGLVGRRKKIITARRVLKKGQKDNCRNGFIFGDNYIAAPKGCWGKFRLCIINEY